MNKYLKIILIPCCLLLLSLVSTQISFAQVAPTSLTPSSPSNNGGYVPLTDLTRELTNGGNIDLGSYIGKLFQFVIGFAGILAVIMIVIGGVQYMSTDSIDGKKDGLDKVKSALWGLLLALASYLILNTINPDLLKLGILQ